MLGNLNVGMYDPMISANLYANPAVMAKCGCRAMPCFTCEMRMIVLSCTCTRSWCWLLSSPRHKNCSVENRHSSYAQRPHTNIAQSMKYCPTWSVQSTTYVKPALCAHSIKQMKKTQITKVCFTLTQDTEVFIRTRFDVAIEEVVRGRRRNSPRR